MDTLEKLVEHFRKFPGIGPRQARRFVYFLLTRENGFLDELARLFKELKNAVALCPSCFRFFVPERAAAALCPRCADPARDPSLLMVVEKDVDAENVERSGAFTGHYFILGGNLPILEKNPEKRIRSRELIKIAEARAKKGLREIVIATSLTPDGEHTAEYLMGMLSPLARARGITLTTLGRGLSTGSELEYSDPETIKSALKNRGAVKS